MNLLPASVETRGTDPTGLCDCLYYNYALGEWRPGAEQDAIIEVWVNNGGPPWDTIAWQSAAALLTDPDTGAPVDPGSIYIDWEAGIALNTETGAVHQYSDNPGWKTIKKAFFPPYDISKVFQIADLVPLAIVCGVVSGGNPVAIAGCGALEYAIAVGAAYAGAADIVQSGCSTGRKVVVGAIIASNFIVDLPPVFGEPLEVALYLASTELGDC